MMKKARVEQIRITNVLGIDDLEIAPGQVTLIEGANGTGKSSVLEALKAVLGGGHDATLLRQGADEGEVVVVLDDGLTARKRITGEKSTLTVKTPEAGRVGKAQGLLSGLVEEASFNPAAFLAASKPDRLRLFLRAVPLKLDYDRLNAIGKGISAAGHMVAPLSAVEMVERDIRGARRDARVVAKSKRATVGELQRSLPSEEDMATDWHLTQAAHESKLAEFEDRKAEAEKAARHACEVAADAVQKRYQGLRDLERETNATAVQRVVDDAAESKDALRAKYGPQGEALKAEMDALKAKFDALETEWKAEEDQIHEAANKVISDLKVALPEAIAKLRELELEELSSAEADRAKALENAGHDFDPIITTVKSQIVAAQAKAEEAARVKNTQEILARTREEAAEREKHSEEMSVRLEELADLRDGLLAELPIEGLNVVDGDIVLDGVPFDRLSTAERVVLAVEIAKAHPGQLGLVIVDGLEAMDPETFEMFVQEAKSGDLQMVCTRVTEGELSVRTVQ